MIVLRLRRKRYPANDRQLVLFDKHDEETAARIEERRLRRLMKIRCDRLTPWQEQELDRVMAQRRAEVQRRWSPAIEAKRREVNPHHVKCFKDSHDRYLPVMTCLPIYTFENDCEEYEE